jgi:uncharacterized protein DUF6677
MASKTTTADRASAAAEPGTLALVCVLAWAIPGAAHFWLGRRQKALVFFTALTALFVSGLLLHGRIFSIDFQEPLGTLAAIANLGLGLPWVIARFAGIGAGQVTALTYEYGNTFLIVGGLLNALVVLDAFDVAMGRK